MSEGSGESLGPCRFVATPGGCRRGNDCFYSHDLDQATLEAAAAAGRGRGDGGGWQTRGRGASGGFRGRGRGSRGGRGGRGGFGGGPRPYTRPRCRDGKDCKFGFRCRYFHDPSDFAASSSASSFGEGAAAAAAAGGGGGGGGGAPEGTLARVWESLALNGGKGAPLLPGGGWVELPAEREVVPGSFRRPPVYERLGSVLYPSRFVTTANHFAGTSKGVERCTLQVDHGLDQAYAPFAEDLAGLEAEVARLGKGSRGVVDLDLSGPRMFDVHDRSFQDLALKVTRDWTPERASGRLAKHEMLLLRARCFAVGARYDVDWDGAPLPPAGDAPEGGRTREDKLREMKEDWDSLVLVDAAAIQAHKERLLADSEAGDATVSEGTAAAEARADASLTDSQAASLDEERAAQAASSAADRTPAGDAAAATAEAAAAGAGDAKGEGKGENAATAPATIVRVANLDTQAAAWQLSQKYQRDDAEPAVCWLNLANAHWVGGGYQQQGGSQEENVGGRSSLFAVLAAAAGISAEPGHSCGRTLYRVGAHIPAGGGYFCRMRFGLPQFRATAISVAFADFRPARPGSSPDSPDSQRHEAADYPNYQDPEDEDTQWRVKYDIVATLRIAHMHGQRVLVLGASGCGAFGHNPTTEARAWRDALALPEFNGAFDEVVFAVLGDENFTVFRDIIDGPTDST